MSLSSAASDPVQVSLTRFRKIEIYDHINSLDIYSSGEQIGRNQTSAVSVSEVVEHSVPVVLPHFRVDLEAGLAQLSDLSGQQLHPH